MMAMTGLLLAAAIRASSFGFDPADSTEALQKAINASAEKVIIDRQAGPWIVRPLFLRNGDKEIVIEDGVEIRAKAGEYQDVNDALFSVWGAKNVSIRGEGTAVLAMNKKDYQDRSKYRPSEWRHALSIRGGAENVGVSNLTLRASGGDGVYIFGASGIRLENLKCLDHHRQGISVISGAHVLVRNCDFSETWGTAPACGIDFEPNRPDEEIVDFVFENCRFNDNQVSGVAFHLVQLVATGMPVSVTFRDCEIRGNREFGVSYTRTMGDSPGVNGFALFERCRFVGNGESVLNIKNQAPEGFRIGFRDCTFDARATKSPAIHFNNGMSLFDFGAVAMRDCRVLRNPGQETLLFSGAVGAGVVGTKGVLDVEENGRHTSLDLAEFAAKHPPHPELKVGFKPTLFDARDLVAPAVRGRIAPVARDAQHFRWKTRFVQYVPAAGEWTVDLLVRRHPTGKDTLGIQLFDRIGTNLGKAEVPAADGPFTFRTAGAGYYVLEINANGNFVDVKSDLPGHGFEVASRTSLFGCSGREYFFRVKEGAEKIYLEMTPDQGEPGRFQLVSPEGEIVADTGVSDATKIIAHVRTGRKPAETWSVRMPLVKEDCRIRLGAGTVPVLSDSREAVCAPAEDGGAAIQRAIDEAWRRGGGTVEVEKGVHPIGGLRLRSNVTLHLQAGAVLLASRNVADYDAWKSDALEPVPPPDPASPHRYSRNWFRGVIRLHGAVNASIVGEPGSAIDGANTYDPEGEEHYRGVHGITAIGVTNCTFRGYTVRRSGNWAHNIRFGKGLRFENVAVEAGHDGIHLRVCDDVEISRCAFRTGDDAIAGFDNADVHVCDCDISSACSAFRFGGRRVLIERCRVHGPCAFPFRGSLDKKTKESGGDGGNGGRRNMLSLFTYFSMKDYGIRQNAGEIVLRDVTVENADRFLQYNFSGNEVWSSGVPLTDIRFENVTATGVKMPLCAYGSEKVPLSLVLLNCRISFAAPQDEVIRGANFGELRADGLSVEGGEPVLLRNYGPSAPISVRGGGGFAPKEEKADEPFKVRAI